MCGLQGCYLWSVDRGPKPAERLSLSNRGESRQSLPLGVDRLSISWVPEQFDSEEKSWSTIQTAFPGTASEQRTWGTTFEVSGATAFVGVRQRAGQPAVAKLELNPARVGDPDGWAPAAVEAVEPAVRRGLLAAGEVVTQPTELGLASVRRLDVTRDFSGVDSVPDFLRAQATLRRPYARLHLVHSDPSKNGAQTLMVGSRSGGVVRGYDKHAENSLAPEGTVRWEAECRGPWAKNYGSISVFAELCRGSVEKLALDRWEWSQMGSEVAGLNRVVDAVMSSGELTNAQKHSFLGFLVFQAGGAGVFCSERQARTYRKWQRDLGLVGERVDLGSRTFTRLDWESGAAVSRVA